MAPSPFLGLNNPRLIFSHYNAWNGGAPEALGGYHPVPLPYLIIEVEGMVEVGGRGAINAYQRLRFKQALKKQLKAAIKQARDERELGVLEDILVSGGPFIILEGSEMKLNLEKLVDPYVFEEAEQNGIFLIDRGNEEVQKMLGKESLPLIQWLQGLLNTYIIDWLTRTLQSEWYLSAIAERYKALHIPKESNSNSKQLRFSLPFGKEKGYRWVDKLYKLLSDQNQLTSSEEEFRGIFGLGEREQYVVNWIGDKNRLYYFIKELPPYFFVPKKKWDTACSCFIIKGEKFTHDELKNSHEVPADKQFTAKLNELFKNLPH